MSITLGRSTVQVALLETADALEAIASQLRAEALFYEHGIVDAAREQNWTGATFQSYFRTTAAHVQRVLSDESRKWNY